MEKAKIIKEHILKENSSIKKVLVGTDRFEVITNKRLGPENFKANNHCTICDLKKEKFVTEMITYEFNVTEMITYEFNICKTCLYKMIEALNVVNLSEIKRG